MFRSLNHCQDITVRGYTKLKLSLLPFEELNMDNDDLATNSEYDICSNNDFSLHHALNQVDLTTNLVDKVILTKVVLRPTKKLRRLGPHKSISKKDGNKRKARPDIKKFRSLSKPLYKITADFNSNNGV